MRQHKYCYKADVYDPMSPTRVSAARRFFFGGPWAQSRVDTLPPWPAESSSLTLCAPSTLSSTLAAGVSGGSTSAFLFIPPTGVKVEETVGNAFEAWDGVDIGVATAEVLVSGKEW